MEPIILYFLKAGALIGLFLAAYYAFLNKETFFKSNRWFLLFGLVISVLLPVVTFKKTIWVEPVSYAAAPPTLNVEYTDMPAQAIAYVEEVPAMAIDWFWITIAIYGIGIVVLLAKFALDYYALQKVLKGKPVYQQEDYKFVNVNENIAPFSYFNYIVYNPELYSPTEMESILEHEKVHCSQNHTLDVLIARLFCIAFWWNPFMWLYKKAITQNLEFIADSDASKNLDKKAYQFTLLKITTHESCVAISNHFFQSLIKKRIVMLNKNQSKSWNTWKYAIIVPVLALFMWQFQMKVVAQEKQSTAVLKDKLSRIVHEVTARSTDAELKEAVALFEQEFGAKLEFSKVKRNSNGEIIAIKASIKRKGDQQNSKSVYQVSSDAPIKSFKVFINVDQNGKEDAGFGELNAKRTVYQNITNNVGGVTIEADEVEEVENVVYSSYTTTHNGTAPTPPTPPMPPTPPAVPNHPLPPATPVFPTPPTPPVAPPTESNRKSWDKFEEEMKKFEAKMNSPEMKKWEKEMEEYGKKMEEMLGENSEFDKQMKQFDKQMLAFDERMKVFDNQMLDYNREVQAEMREDMKKEREEARKARYEERANATKEKAKAMKEREAARKDKK